MARPSRGGRRETKRFTVTVEADDYRRLKALAETHRPRLSLQYVVNFAIQRLLQQTENRTGKDALGDPLDQEGRSDAG